MTDKPSATVKQGHMLAHATAENSPLVAGRREFFKYRDLGIVEVLAHARRPTGKIFSHGTDRLRELPRGDGFSGKKFSFSTNGVHRESS